MSDLSQPARPKAIFEWPITVLAGFLLCAITLVGVDTLRSHGIISVVLSIIATSGIVQSVLPARDFSGAHKITAIVLALVASCFSSAILWASGVLETGFLALTFAICQLCVVPMRSHNKKLNGPTRLFVCSALLIFGFSAFVQLSFDMIVLIMCLASLVIALIEMSSTPAKPVPKHVTKMNWLSILGTADIWIAVLILPPAQVNLYHAARLLTLLLPSALHAFDIWVEPAVFQTRNHAGHVAFVKSMARVNLSLFLIAAAVGLIILTPQKAAFIHLLGIGTSADAVAVYMLLAAFIPASLGQSQTATNLLIPARVQWGTQFVGLCAGACVVAIASSVQAETVALGYLTFTVLTALIQCLYTISRSGIWPGPTALLAKQIRLLD